VHQYLCAVLELVEQRVIKRVCVSCPPRTGKSLTTTVLFPAWALSRNPKLEIIQGGYSSDLSAEFSVVTKALLNSERYKYLMGDMIAKNQNRQEDWKTFAQGHYFATSVGGGAVGRGADILLVDDVFKDRADARSASRRKAVWEWFTSAALTRLSPDGVALVIGTRWHKDDLIGRLTSPEYRETMREAGLPEEQWFEINIEAICENPDTDVLRRQFGESHWPERWDTRKLKAIEKRIGLGEYSAQYQGKPRPDGASECDVSKVRKIDRSDMPEGLRLFRAWDLALGEKEANDWSCGAYGAMDDNGNMYLVHMDRKKRRWLDQKEAILSYANRESVGSRIAVEGVAAWKVAIEELQKASEGKFSVRSYNPTKDKVVRATPWMALIDSGKFFIVKAGWNEAFMQELEDFPTGSHDDQIDAVSILYYMCKSKGTLLVA
jgi:predicted phage terminase large subunit-like protein